MKQIPIIAAILIASSACSSGGGSKGSPPTPKATSYTLTDTEKVGNALRLTFATKWPAIQCSASIDGLKVGSGQGNSLAGVAKVSIYLPTKYGSRPAGDFVIECSQY